MSIATDDRIILNTWAGPSSQSIQDGYDYISHSRQITRSQAKRQVHEALKRAGYNPHSSHTLVNAWVRLHKQYIELGGHE